MLKVAVIGGGSTYTPELVNGFLTRQDLSRLSELWLMDIDPETVGGSSAALPNACAAAKGAPFKVILTTDRRESVSGAAYVITQLRVGKMEARGADEYLGQAPWPDRPGNHRHRRDGKSLRTIPVILDLAKDMREAGTRSALLVNFTNPSGLVTEALSAYAPDVAAVGVCNVAIHTKMELLEGFEKLYRREDRSATGLS